MLKGLLYYITYPKTKEFKIGNPDFTLILSIVFYVFTLNSHLLQKRKH